MLIAALFMLLMMGSAVAAQVILSQRVTALKRKVENLQKEARRGRHKLRVATSGKAVHERQVRQLDTKRQKIQREVDKKQEMLSALLGEEAKLRRLLEQVRDEQEIEKSEDEEEREETEEADVSAKKNKGESTSA